MIQSRFQLPGGGLKSTRTVALPTELELEYFANPRSSYSVRTTLGYNYSALRMFYYYTGVEKNFYFKTMGNAVGVSRTSQEGEIAIDPLESWRFSVGLGFSQLVVYDYTTASQADSTLAEIGSSVSWSRKIIGRLRGEVLAGFSFGVGISNVSVLAITPRVLAGFNYTF